jgi:nicotinamidase-related amidase
MSRRLECLLTPGESVVALIDYQPQMFFGVGSHERQVVLNNAVALAKAANLFDVPVVLTTVAAQTFSGALLPEIQAVFPDQVPIGARDVADNQVKGFIVGLPVHDGPMI